MCNQRKIKQKALALAVTSVMGTGFMVNNCSVSAMKTLKKVFSSVPSEEKLAEMMYKKICYVLKGEKLDKEEKLINYLDKIKVPGGYVKVKTSEGKIITVNPIISCMKKFSKYDTLIERRFVEFLKWVSLYIPEAFDSREFVSNDSSATPLFFAMQKYNETVATKVCKELLSYKPDLTKTYKLTDSETQTVKKTKKVRKITKKVTREVSALEYAQEKELPEIIEIIATNTEDKQYLLYNAICSGNQEEVKKAISRGANVNELVYGLDSKKYFPISLALGKKDFNMANFLIQNGSSIPNTIFETALKNKDLKVVEFLIQNSAKIPENALDITLINRDVEMFDYLIQNGVKISENALDITLINRDAKMFDYLIQNGAKLSPNASPIELIFKDFGNQKWSFWEDQNNITFLEKMIQDERINIIWKEDYNEFFNCTLMYTSKVIRDFYFEHCEEVPDYALVDVCRSKDISELQKIETVKFLLSKGYDVNKSTEYDCPIHSACELHQYNLAKLLINYGAKLGKFRNTMDCSTVLATTICSCINGINHLRPDKAWVDFIKFLVNECKVPVNGNQFYGDGLIHAFRPYLRFPEWYYKEMFIPNEEETNNILEVAKVLIENHMNLNAICREGTFIGYALNISRDALSDVGKALVDLFIQHGAKRYLD